MNNSQSETAHIFIYNGSSMQPTFKPGQVLYIRPETKNILPGDIIVYQGRVGPRNIVHRVVSVSKNGFLTRGDNNKGFDPYPVDIVQVIGKVEKVEKSGTVSPVLSGKCGLSLAKVYWLFLWLDSWIRSIFWKPYSALRNSKIIFWIWHPIISVVHLQTEHGLLVKYIHKHQTVATWNSEKKKFDCRKPYDLIIRHPQDVN